MEVLGLRKALTRESASLVSTYATIKRRITSEESFYEHEGEALLHDSRLKYSKDLYLGPSFPAIIGSGPNGAIVHYRPVEDTSAKCDQLTTPILIDTGGHYLDGTTDTTRTLCFDKCPSITDIKEMYTRVLMGNLDLQLACFPANKTQGMALENFARQHLW